VATWRTRVVVRSDTVSETFGQALTRCRRIRQAVKQAAAAMQ
jgi:hypothetical protein